MKPIIEVKKLSKMYKIRHEAAGYITLRDVLMNVLRSPFAFLKKKAKEVTGFEKQEIFWALKDVNFEVMPGETLGIIGANGAGKSTLLKILSKITPPTEGEVVIRGKMASLLEVGTGFHPELSGRENIYLNGAILGMSRVEIAKQFDAIVAFAGVERFLDTPVKHYSSGMYVRLAFAVAAHMEPDILVIDEVLAVGDAEFQKKCLGKMDEVTRQAGRTILFVSHNMPAVKQICKRCILIEKGKIKMIGPTAEVISQYVQNLANDTSKIWEGDAGDEHLRISRSAVRSLDSSGDFHTAADIEVTVEGEVLLPIQNLILGFHLFSEFGYELAYTLYDDHETDSVPPIVQPGKFKKRFVIPANTLAQGPYWIEFDIGIHNTKRIIKDDGRISFTVKNVIGLGRRFPVPDNQQGFAGLLRPDWSTDK